MVEMTLEELIKDSLEEANMLEYGYNRFDEERMLLTAMRLSGAPYSFVLQVYNQREVA